MRGHSKPWPPEDVSPDGHAARRFVDAERDYRAALPSKADKTAFARTEFDRLNKSKLRAVMYREQRSICVFCERPIAESQPPPHVEHWRPLSGDHDHALHWRNLYLSCPTVDTCDSAKGDRPLRRKNSDPDLPWPTDVAYEDLVGFSRGGEMYVRNDTNLDLAIRRALELAITDQLDGGQQRRTILNLNHPALVAARKAALDSQRLKLERTFPNHTATRIERETLARTMLEQDPAPGYVSIRVSWLKGTLGKGR